MKAKVSSLRAERNLIAARSDVCVGRLVGITNVDAPLVTHPGSNAMVEAKTTVKIGRELLGELHENPIDVLLLFEDCERTKPVIIGLVQDTIIDHKLASPDAVKDDLPSALIDGRRVELHAENEIELRCGHSSIILQRDGRIIIRGTKIVSRSSGVNKIKGASVGIN